MQEMNAVIDTVVHFLTSINMLKFFRNIFIYNFYEGRTWFCSRFLVHS